MSDTAIQLEHVFKKFKKGEVYNSLRDLIPALTRRSLKRKETLSESREFWVLKDVNFQVARGESLGIIGHNGAGKSTILKHLSGIMEPTKGKITVNGKLSALIEVGAGFHQDLTGRENIFLNGTILGMRREEIKRKFDEIVAFSGLEDFIDTPVKRYSSGMFARLGFSVAVHLEPDILVIDEVLSVGDFLFQKKGVEKMKKILDGGATVIFISHNLKAVSDLCQRTILLDHGQIIQDGPTNDVIKFYMDKNLSSLHNETNKDLTISKVSVRNEHRASVQFSAGEKAWVEVDISASRDYEKLAVVLDIKDEDYYHIFDTSTERLGSGTFSIKSGETKRVNFLLNLNLAPGAYYFTLTIYRYDIQKAYYELFPAATIYISSDVDVRGIANLFPQAHID